MSDADASPFREVWVMLGRLRERVELMGYDITAEGMQLLNAIVSLETNWNAEPQRKDAKFYDDMYLMVRQFGTNYGSRDSGLPQLVAKLLKALIGAKKKLIASAEAQSHS